MADPKYIGALVVVLCIDAVLLMGQFAIMDINPDANITFIHYSNTTYSQYDNGAFVMNTGNISSQVPGATLPVSVSDDTFTDTLPIFRTWTLGDKIINTVSTVAFGPGVYLANPDLGLPTWFSFLICSTWFILTMFLLVILIFQR
jgi:hypothetical protein